MLRKSLTGAKVVLATFAPARFSSPFRKIQFPKNDLLGKNKEIRIFATIWSYHRRCAKLCRAFTLENLVDLMSVASYN